MRTLTVCVALLVLTAGISLADQWIGWLADEKCATGGKFSGEEHKKCVESGQPIVFVNDSGNKTARSWPCSSGSVQSL